eukprot:6844845-Pyramimonas_sp.AAC.1
MKRQLMSNLKSINRAVRGEERQTLRFVNKICRAVSTTHGLGRNSDVKTVSEIPLDGWAPAQVYDVTKYLDDHPGGHDVLLDASGAAPYTSLVDLNLDFELCSDATEDFNDVGHSKPAIASMEKYLIGEFA